MSENDYFDEKTLPVLIDQKSQEFITLNEIIEKKVNPTSSLKDLDNESIKKLIVERFRQIPDLKLSIHGVHIIIKDQAIKEINQETEIGNQIIKTEKKAMQKILSDYNL